MGVSSDFKYELFNVTFPHEYVAHVEINRPQKLNAFTLAMFEDMCDIFRKLSVDKDVRAVVLSGAGNRGFTAGLDVAAAAGSENIQPKDTTDPARSAAYLRRSIRQVQSYVTALEECEKPVIAVMHGISYGAAIDISTACDIRVCSKDTRFSVREVDIGLAADVGTLARLPHSGVNMSFVKEIALTARDFNAQEALQHGLVSGVYEDKAAALARGLELAKIIGTKSPVAVQGTKEVINYSKDHTVAEGNNYIVIWNSAALQTKDVEDSMTAGLTKKKPKYAKL